VLIIEPQVFGDDRGFFSIITTRMLSNPQHAFGRRRSSVTFGRLVGIHLSAENKRQLWVHEGFDHGFLVLSDAADFLYKMNDYYAPQHERCIRWDDPDLN